MKILLVRVGRLGDIVMILPALAAIKRCFPEATYYAVTSADGMRLLKAQGWQASQLQLYRNSIFYRLFDILKVKRFIRQGHFDKIFCFENKKRTVSWLPKHAAVISSTAELEHYALRCVKVVTSHPQELYQQSYLAFNPLKMPQVQQRLQNFAINDSTILIGLHPTYSGFLRKKRRQEHCHRLWPWQHFALLAEKLIQYGKDQSIDIKIIMDLLPEEQEIGLKIQQASAGKVILFSDKPDFQRYLCLLKRLNLLIVANTGVMHLAAALNTPLVALFSQLHPQDCGPYMPQERFRVLRAEDTVAPAQGLAAIPVEQVFAAALQLVHSELQAQDNHDS